MRYCDALTSATAYGYWVFPPMTFRLLWDGAAIFWSFGDDEDAWIPLSGTESGAAQFPNLGERFDAVAPEALQGYSPPFLSALPEPGGLQIWTGLLARTRPGWSLNVRPPVNLPAIPNLMAWEGIVETDIWLGPLFSNFRITKTDTPVLLRANVPFLQVQPVPQLAYRDDVQNALEVVEADAIEADEWSRLGDVLIPSPDWERRQGDYAVTVRKRRLCPVDHRRLVPAEPDAGVQLSLNPASLKP